jgi:hypothetical protein
MEAHNGGSPYSCGGLPLIHGGFTIHDFLGFLKHKNDIIFKGTRRLKTCHWVLIGAIGPADLESTVPTQSSSRVRFDTFCCFLNRRIVQREFEHKPN